jgi:hypothetical protein
MNIILTFDNWNPLQLDADGAISLRRDLVVAAIESMRRRQACFVYLDRSLYIRSSKYKEPCITLVRYRRAYRITRPRLRSLISALDQGSGHFDCGTRRNGEKKLTTNTLVYRDIATVVLAQTSCWEDFLESSATKPIAHDVATQTPRTTFVDAPFLSRSQRNLVYIISEAMSQLEYTDTHVADIWKHVRRLLGQDGYQWDIVLWKFQELLARIETRYDQRGPSARCEAIQRELTLLCKSLKA